MNKPKKGGGPRPSSPSLIRNITEILDKDFDNLKLYTFATGVNIEIGNHIYRLPSYPIILNSKNNFITLKALLLCRTQNARYRGSLNCLIKNPTVFDYIRSAVNFYKLPANCLCASPLLTLRKTEDQYYFEVIGLKDRSHIVPLVYISSVITNNPEEVAFEVISYGVNTLGIVLRKSGPFAVADKTFQDVEDFLKRIKTEKLEFDRGTYRQALIGQGVFQLRPELYNNFCNGIRNLINGTTL